MKDLDATSNLTTQNKEKQKTNKYISIIVELLETSRRKFHRLSEFLKKCFD